MLVITVNAKDVIYKSITTHRKIAAVHSWNSSRLRSLNLSPFYNQDNLQFNWAAIPKQADLKHPSENHLTSSALYARHLPYNAVLLPHANSFHH